MNILHQQLFSLLRIALTDSPVAPSILRGCDWAQLMVVAQEQTVTGVIADATERLPKELMPPLDLRKQLLLETLQIEQRSQANLRSLSDLLRAYDAIGLHPVLLKGLVMAQEYPHPQHREAGDIDLWLNDPDEVRRAISWTERRIGKKLVIKDKEAIFSWKGTLVELHWRLADMQYPAYQQSLQSIIGQQMEREGCRIVALQGLSATTLSLRLTLLHLLIHLQYHILNEGVGLRQFCDLALFLRHHSSEFDATQVGDLLRLSGIDRMAAAIGWILHEHLGLAPEEIPFPIAPEGAGLILDDIWTGGNFGKKKWGFKATDPLWKQKVKALPLHWRQYRRYRSLLPHEAWANFLSKFPRAVHELPSSDSRSK